MDGNNKAQINLREMLQMCRSTLDDLSSNTLFAVMREQNVNFGNALNLIEKYLPIAENMLDQDKADRHDHKQCQEHEQDPLDHILGHSSLSILWIFSSVKKPADRDGKPDRFSVPVS